jgi:transcriptional antiterminator RfaH
MTQTIHQAEPEINFQGQSQPLLQTAQPSTNQTMHLASSAQAPAATAQAADQSAPRLWYVIFSKPQQEQRALRNLTEQGFTCYLPLLQRELVRKGKLTLSTEPLFKRYLFVQFDAHHSPWHVIRSTPGVTALLRFGDRLATVPAAMIDHLQQQATPAPALYAPGSLLQVTGGPFKNLQVLYQMPDGEQRALVLIELLNKTHRVALDWQVFKAAR